MSDLINGLQKVQVLPVRTMVNTPSGIKVVYATQTGQLLAIFDLFCLDQSILPDLLADAAGAFRTAIVRAPAGMAEGFKT